MSANKICKIEYYLLNFNSIRLHYLRYWRAKKTFEPPSLNNNFKKTGSFIDRPPVLLHRLSRRRWKFHVPPF